MADAAAHTADSTAAEVSARMTDSNADQHATAAHTAPKAVQLVQEEDGETYAVLNAADQHATAADTAPKAAAVATQTKAGKGSRRVLFPDSVPMGAVAASAPIEGTASEYVRIVQGEDGWHG